MSAQMTDDSNERQLEHELVHALPEGPQKELAEWLHQWCHFPDKPVIEGPTYDDELIGLTYRAGGSFYLRDGQLVFFPLTELELHNWWVDDHLKDPEYKKKFGISD